MMYPVPFEAEHVFNMELQPAQTWLFDYLAIENLRPLENMWATTLMEDGTPILCGGPMVFWHNRALMWSFISTKVSRDKFLRVHKRVKNYLDSLPFARLEATVDVDFKAGHRWMKSLGFKMEAARMVGYDFDGRDCALYAKVRR